MVKATKEDAALIVQIFGIATADEKYSKAVNWFQYEMKEKSYEDFIKKYPIGSDGYQNFLVLMSYGELIGSLVVCDVLSEDLVFEMWAIEMIWQKSKPIVYGLREQLQMPRFMENIEALANRYPAWAEKHPIKI